VLQWASVPDDITTDLRELEQRLALLSATRINFFLEL
jgi:hypothetical protein